MARKGYKADKHMVGIVRVPRAVLLRSTALQGIAALCAVLPFDYVYAQPAPNAHPTSPVTQLGSGSYSYNGTTTTINQTSPVLATGWQSFNVGAAQAVQINQPSQRAISVNRVLTSDPSQIAGRVNANGVFVLVNPNGVVFSQGAQVNAASVIVSTADVANRNLAAGKLIFDQPGKPGAMVINNGNISVKATGLAALVAPGVVNAGTISAPFGRVALAGGEASVIDLYGDGLMSIDVTRQVTTVPKGPDGKPVAALVTNTGVITATGGRVELSARAVDGIVTNLVDAGGKIAANTAPGGRTGTVVINGIGGSITIEGDVSAAGTAPGTKGGAIELNASNAVNLTSTAKVSASGQAGGGTVAIGTSLARAAGGPSVTGAPTARTVTIAAGAQVSADATTKGDGGRVTVLSTDNTDMGGLITATGGTLGGNGGFVEVSGYQGFSLTGSINVGAPVGATGTILLDPNTLVIVSGTAGAGGLDGTLGAGGGPTYNVGPGGGASTDTVTNGEIDSLTGNVVLQAGTLLTIQNSTPLTLHAGSNLALESGGSVTVGTGSDITLSGGGSLVVVAGTSMAGSITLNSNIDTGSAGGVSLQAFGSISLNGVTISTPLLDMTTSGSLGVTQSNTGVLDVTTLQSSGNVAGAVSLPGQNNIGTLGGFVASGSFSLNNAAASALQVTGSVGAGTLLSIAAPSLALGTAGTLASSGGLVSVMTDTLAATGAAALIAGSGTIEIAPKSAIALNYGGATSAGTLTIPTVLAINAGTLRLGQTAGTTTATSIAIASATSFSAVGTVDFETMGGVTQAGSLAGVAIMGNAGSVTMTNANNAITAIGNFTAATGFTLTNSAALPINGVLTANAGTVVVGAGSNLLTVAGTVIAPEATLSGATLSIPGSLNISGLGSLIASSKSITGDGRLTLGTLAATAATAIDLTGTNAIASIGSVSSAGFTLTNGGSLSVDGLLNAGAAAAVINTGTFGLTVSSSGTIATSANTSPGIVLNAGSIILNGSLSAPAASFSVTATSGAITQAGTAAMTVAGLTGSAGGQASFAGTANAVGGLGAFTSNGFTLIATAGTNLSQAGMLNAGTSAAFINAGTFRFDNNGTILGTSITINAGTIGIAGSLGAGTLVSLNASTADVTQTAGFVSAGTLAGAANTTASFNAGSIASVGSFITGGGFTLTGNTSTLSVKGLIEGNTGSVVLNNGSLGLALASTGTIHGIEATLAAGSISLGGTVNVSGLLNLVGSVGAISELAAANLNAGTLTGSSGTGTALILGSNTIVTLGAFTAGGGFALADTRALLVNAEISATAISLSTPMLTLGGAATDAGTLVASGGLVSLQTGSFVAGTAGGTIDTGSTGTIAFAPMTSGDTVVLGAGAAGTASFDPSATGLTLNDGTLRLGAVNGTTVAGSVSIVAGAAAYTIPGTLDLEASGGVTQGTSLTAGTLIGNAGSVVLITAGNSVGTLGAFATTNGFTLTDGVSLSVGGLVNGGTAGVVLSTGSLGLGIANGGGVTGAAISLSAGSIDINGSLATPGTLTLAANAGTIAEPGTGSIGALALTGSAAGIVSLLGTGDAVGTIAGFSAVNGFTLTNTASLTTTGVLDAHSGSVVINNGTAAGLAIAGTITAMAGSLSAGSIDLTGSLGVSGLASLNAPGGAITQAGSAFLNAGTLAGSAKTTASLLGTNAVGTLGNFSADTLLLNAGTAGLSVAGVVMAGQSVALSTGSLLAINGSIVPAAGSTIAVSLTGDTITVGGLISDGGTGHTGLFATNAGTITETGSLIVGTLTGSATVANLSSTTNTIAALGSFTAGTLLLHDTRGLSIPGVVTIGTLASILAAGSIDLSGSLMAAAGSTIAVGLTATNFTLGGLLSDGGSGTTTLAFNGGTIAETTGGTLIAGTLVGSADVISLPGTGNAFPTIAGLSAGSTLVVFDTLSLSLSGTEMPSGLLSVTSPTLSVSGLVGAPQTTLVATTGSLTMDGTLSSSGTVVLGGRTGILIDTGTILGGGTVIATSGSGAVNLSSPNITIAAVSGSAATNFVVNDGSANLSAGNINAGTLVSIVTTGSLTVSGSIAPLTGTTAIAVGLTANGIGIAGGVSDGGFGSTFLNAGTGALTGAGQVISGTLSASGTVFGLSGANTIGAFGTLANFESIVLNDGGALLISGPISATTLVAITAATLRVQNTIAAPSTTLSATGGTLSLTSTIDATGNIALSGSAGIAGGTATLIGGGSVSANSTSGSIDLSNTANAIASITGSAHTDFRINDSTALGVGNVTGGGTTAIGAPVITVSGTVGAPHISLVASTGSLNVAAAGLVRPSIDALLSAAGGRLSIDGVVSPPSGNVSLTLSGATLAIGGLVDAGLGGSANLLVPLNSGTITETGTLIAGTLTGTAGLASLTDPGFSNQIATLGAFTGQTLIFNDGTALTVAGPVSIGSVIAINDPSSITIPGTIAPLSGSVISVGLTATALTITGLVSDSGTGRTALVINGGTIIETAGTLVAGALTGTADIAGLTGSANAIGTLGVFGANTSFALVDSTGLTVIGPAGGAPVVMVTAPSISIGNSGSAGTLLATSGGRLSISTETLIAGSAGGTLSAAGGVIEVAPTLVSEAIALGMVSSSGTLGFTPSAFAIAANVLRLGAINGAVASDAITVAGPTVSIINVPTLDIRTSGTFSQSMSLAVSTLTGTAAAVELTTPGNAIGTIGVFSVANDFAVTNVGSLSVAGPLISSGGTVVLNNGSFGIGVPGSISAVAAYLTGGSIDIGGSLGVAGIASLVANQGSVSVTGALTAQTLIGSAAGSASFAGAESVGTLGNFAAAAGFSLTEAQPMVVAGNVVAPTGSVVINTGVFDLTVPGTIGGQGASLTAGNITIGGTLGVNGLATLIANVGSISETGVLTAGTLAGSVVTTGSFTGANGIGTLGNFTAPSGFAINDGQSLSVAGLVASSSGSIIVNTGTFGLGIPGGLTAQAVYLTAGSIDIPGSLGATGVAQLIAGQGSISQTGSLTAQTLTGSAATTASFSGVDSVGTLGNFTAPGGFSLGDGRLLSVTGIVASSSGTVVLNTGSFGLGVPGTITGLAASLTAGSIDLGGSLTVSGLARFIANQGSVSETGFLNAGTVAGSAVTTAHFTGTNLVGTLGNFAAPSGFSLNDGQLLAVSGSVSASGGTVTLNTGTFGIGVSGAITGLAATVTAGSIDIGGSLGVSGVADLMANKGTIGETGSLVAGTLTGSAVTTASFGGTNLIGTLASFAAPNGFSLTDGELLSVAGAVTASSGTIVLNTGTFGLGVPGSIGGVAATLTAGSIDIGGSLGVSGVADLIASAGSISETGSLNAGTLTGSAITTTSFGGANLIGTLAGFVAPSGFSLNDGQLLAVTGPLSASSGTIALNTGTFGLGVSGAITGLAATLSAGSIDLSGSLAVTGVADLIASKGSIGETGTLSAGTLTGSAITAASFGGSNVVPTLGNFTAPDGFSLTNSHSLGVAGSVSASSGTIVLSNGTFALDIPGTITGSAVTISAGTIGLTGSLGATGIASLTAVNGGVTEAATAFLNAGTLTGSVLNSAAFIGTNVIGTLGLFSAPSGFTLADAGTLSVAGAVTAAAGTIAINTGTFGLTVPGSVSGLAATLTAGSIGIAGSLGVSGVADLIANQGSISETGSVVAGTLTGGAITTASFGGTNLIGTLASFTAPNGFTLADGAFLSVTGPVVSSGGAIILNTGTFGLGVPGSISGVSATLSAGSIDIGGSLGVSGVAELIANQGSIGETGSLVAGTLTGSAITTASFGGANLIGTLASFAAPDGFSLTDGALLSVAGAVTSTAGTIVLNTGTFGLSVPGSISGLAATLSAGSIDIGGSLGVGGVADLIAGVGSINATGSVNAGTLTGSAITTASFGGANLIGTLGTFSATSGFSLHDGEILAVAGQVTSSAGTISLDTGAFGVSIPGGISGLAATITAGSIDLGGSLGVSGIADLTASSGAITEGGSLTAGTLTGSANSTASFTGTNTITTLAGFAAPGGLTVIDSRMLTVTNLVTSGGTVVLNTGGQVLSVQGTISGSAATLVAGSIDIPGSLGVTGQALLAVNTGSITESGIISAGTLLGTAGVASLTGATALSNQIGTLGGFTAGTLTLRDGMALNIAGPVSIGSSLVVIENGLLSVTGSVIPTAGNIAIGLTAATLGISGLLSAGTGGTENLTVAGGTITETTGTLIAGTLTGTADTALLNGPTNVIATLGSFAAGTTLIVLDTGSLLVAGSVTAGSLATITAPTVTVASLVSAPSTTLTATAGTLTLNGTVNATGSAILSGSQAIAGASGLLTGGGTVTATSAAGAVTLSNTLNAVAMINGAAASSFAFGDSTALAIGQVNAGSSVAIVDNGALTLAGTIAPLGGGTAIAVGLTAMSLAIAGLLDDGGAGTTTLVTNPGGITETGTIIAGTLSAMGTNIVLSSTNTIAALGNINGGPTLIVADTSPLTIVGLATASTLLAISAPTLTVSGTVVSPTSTLAATTGTLGIGGTVDATSLAVLTGATGINGASGLITGGGTLSAISSGGSVILTDAANSVASVGGSANGDFLFLNQGSVGVNTVTAGGIASIGAAAIGVTGTVGAPNVTLAASNGNLTVSGAVDPGVSGTLTAAYGTIIVPGGASIAPPSGTTAIALGLSAQQIVIAGLVSDGGAGTTSLIVPRGTGMIQETGTLIAGTLTGTALLANLTDVGFSNHVATLAAFDAGSLVLNDQTALTVAGPVTIGSAIAINDTASVTVTGMIAPDSGTSIAVGLTASALSITGTVSDGGSGGTFLTATSGSIFETGKLIAGSVFGTASGNATLIGANSIAEIATFTAGGNLLLYDGVSLQVNGAFYAGTAGGNPSSAEIDVLGSNANLTIGSGGVVRAGLEGSATGLVTLRAGSDSVTGGVEIDGAVFAANSGTVMVTAGYNVGSNAWNVVGKGSTITLTGTIAGGAFGGSPAGLVNLGAAGSIDEPVTAASIDATLLTGRAGGHVNLAETANGALAPVPSANRIATLGAFVSNASTDDPLGFLLRDGQALTVTGPVIDEGASASRGIAISVVPGSGASYTAANLTIAGKLQADTTVNPQATGSVIEAAGGSIVAKTLTTQSGVIPSTETSGNTAGSYPATIIAGNASAFYGNASGANVNQIGTLANVTSTGTLTLYDTPNLAVLGSIIAGITPTGSSIAGTVAVGTGMTLVTPGILSVSGVLDVASQAGVMSLTGNSVSLGGSAGSATLKAATIQVFAASGVTTANGTNIYTGGDVFKRPSSDKPPVDPGPATAGAHFLVGPVGFTENGQLNVLPYVADNASGAAATTHPELDIRLTSGSGAIAFDYATGLSAPSSSLLLDFGSAGTSYGRILANSVSVFYTNTSGPPTNLYATLFTASGVQVSGQAAASQALIAKAGVFIPSTHFQVNACSISSINCVLISPFATVPIFNPLRDLPTDFLTDEENDPDLLIPNVSDQED